MGKFDNPAVQLHEFKGELFKSVEQCQRFLFSEMDVQFLDCLIVIHSYGHGNCRNSSVSLTTYSIVARSVRITLNSSLKIRAAMNLV